MQWLPLLALPLGYVLGWFLYGLPVLPLLALLVGVVLTLAYLQDGRRGMGDFSVLTLLLAAISLLTVGGFFLSAAIRSSSSEVVEVILPSAALAVAVALLVLVPLMIWMRRTRRTASSPAAPWLLLAGLLSLAFFPAVRVDCRGLQQDDFLNYGSDFHSHAQTPRWVRNPKQLPDRNELPPGFQVEMVGAGLVGCERQPLSFRAIRPLLIVHLTNKVQPGMQAYAAAFTLGDHHKLTRWTQVEEMPFTLSLRAHKPRYRVPGWTVFPTYPETPPELAALLEQGR